MELVKNLKQINVIKYFLIVLISSLLLAISAKLKIPFYPVPMTMQTFVVLLIGVYMDGNWVEQLSPILLN